MAENPNVLLDTTEGEILIELYPDKAPETVANFLKYVDEGFYKKMVNRGAEEFSCIACLSRYFDLREEQSRALIERWRAAGCALFCSEGERE